MRILITGSNGLLGQKVVDLCLLKKIEFLASSKGLNRYSKCPNEKYISMDITVQSELESQIQKFHPTHIIHTAAMTNVDACELEPILCDQINRKSVSYLAPLCARLGIHLQLLSTDFVFDGENGPYCETDIPNPLSEYAKSKFEAEQLLFNEFNLKYSIVRTIIVYGMGENLTRSNIVLWAIDSLNNNKELKIVDDQFRAPTWADDLAWACLAICEKNQSGIFHISGPETLSILQIVERIADFLQRPKDKIIRTHSKELNQPAKRPPRTGFDLTKAQTLLNYKPKTLEETLELLIK